LFFHVSDNEQIILLLYDIKNQPPLDFEGQPYIY
jgi:hypothetical protein